MTARMHIAAAGGALLLTGFTLSLLPMLERLSPHTEAPARIRPVSSVILTPAARTPLPEDEPRTPPASSPTPMPLPMLPERQLQAAPMHRETTLPVLSLPGDIPLPYLSANLAIPYANELAGTSGAGGTLTAETAADSPKVPTRPQILSQPRPVYPYRAKLKGISGKVIVTFTVHPDGTTGDVHSFHATPPGYFERAAEDAVKSWRFLPEKSGGNAEPVRMKVQIVFDIENP